MIQDYSLRLQSQGRVTDYGLGLHSRITPRTTLRITIRTTFSDYDMTYRSPSTGYALVYKELVHVLSVRTGPESMRGWFGRKKKRSKVVLGGAARSPEEEYEALRLTEDEVVQENMVWRRSGRDRGVLGAKFFVMTKHGSKDQRDWRMS